MEVTLTTETTIDDQAYHRAIMRLVMALILLEEREQMSLHDVSQEAALEAIIEPVGD